MEFSAQSRFEIAEKPRFRSRSIHCISKFSVNERMSRSIAGRRLGHFGGAGSILSTRCGRAPMSSTVPSTARRETACVKPLRLRRRGGLVVGFTAPPCAREDSGSRAAEDADRMRMPTTSAARSGVHACGLGGCVPGVVGEAGQGRAQASVAGPSEADAAAFSGLSRDRGEAFTALGWIGTTGWPAASWCASKRSTTPPVSLSTTQTACSAPPQSGHESHGIIPSSGAPPAPAGRTCGKLIVRRSARPPTAHQPVARRAAGLTRAV